MDSLTHGESDSRYIIIGCTNGSVGITPESAVAVWMHSKGVVGRLPAGRLSDGLVASLLKKHLINQLPIKRTFLLADEKTSKGKDI